ncbi:MULTISPECIES: aldolase [Pseudomonas syringae group]|uniref:Aldolase n=3 Tax=Pseudomonas syringae group TaxID=136849 RepID=A0AA40TTA5_9PSED|nr:MULTISPECIES: aldolase [Pseudomonas syringae group]KGS15803.1 aldolase [Pseudomonas coronafaciens]KOP56542.1 aldolase [Pseudomonas coronafaciens pv. porri]KOP60870.1 aldolase [Pseudomonas coronafaciens pv. porri]KPB54846.1 Class II aldolase/adducin domain protein [Pseudomonas coronafaciens pv. oryzae]KPX32061.1 s II aldolase/adducin domain protein [Pseudomonas coronafaciens pv. garcae]
MAKTLALPKDQLVKQALEKMQSNLADNTWTEREKLALTCRILYENGHDSGLSGQITTRGPEPGTYYTQQLGMGFDEITAGNLLLVNEDLDVLEGSGMPNPANRFHSWVYRGRTDVMCMIHTHPTHIAALSMLELPLVVSHMDVCPLYDDCAFLEHWPGIPVGNEEGELITRVLGEKRAVLLAHHGQLSTGRTIEEACVTALLIERAAKLQLLASAAGEIKPIRPELGQEAHDWISRPKRHSAAFNYYARQILRRHADCLN